MIKTLSYILGQKTEVEVGKKYYFGQLWDGDGNGEDFVKESERIIFDFIKSNDTNGHDYSLIEKANKPLLIW